MQFQYPLNLSFKLLAINPQISIRDANGREVLYVHMKAFKLKEDITIFSDSSKSQALFSIKADRIIDFSARYHITAAGGVTLGSVKREGMRSLWKASYFVSDQNEMQTHHIREDNPWMKVLDSMFSDVPLVGSFFFHPSYSAYQAGTERAILQIKKEPALFESVFSVIAHDPGIDNQTEARLLLSLVMMILLERARG